MEFVGKISNYPPFKKRSMFDSNLFEPVPNQGKIKYPDIFLAEN